jgi:hypothetical protein
MNTITQFKEEKEKLLQNVKELYKLSYCKNLLSDIKKKIEENQKQDITYYEIRNTLTGVYKINTQRSMIIDTFIIVLKEQFEKMQTQNEELNKIISNFNRTI